ncbi:MAG: outer membrane transport energization protein [Prolixibacteraceae bacterium]|nr:MAG: outer membrane transport energization protein [Prolixibacteraceae bacterium]
MNSVVNFIIESGVSLSLLAIIFVLFLRRETFFRTNRLFLLGSVLFSVVLPLIRLRIFTPQPVTLAEVTVTPYQNLFETITIYSHGFSGNIEKAILSTQILKYIYLAGVAVLLGLFLFRLIHILLKISKNRVKKGKGFNLIYLNSETTPFSFLNFVFVGKNSIQDAGYDRMLAHELEHVRQGHSFDVIILELLTAFQWFNPFMWILRRAIRENHEYLADQAVLTSGVSRGEYKKLLINQFVGGQLVIANNFNYSIIKNRIKMMSKIQSPKLAITKTILGVFVAVALIVAFACEQKESVETKSAQNDEITIITTIQYDGKIKIEGTSDDLLKYKALFADTPGFEFISDSLGNTFLIKKEIVQPKSLSADEQIFFIVEEMPEYPGGEMALRQFIANSVKYPTDAQEKGIQGKVYVSFVVSKDGSVASAKIARGVNPSLDAEALRVVNALPKWKPGMQKGKAVNVSYTVPINFVLQ